MKILILLTQTDWPKTWKGQPQNPFTNDVGGKLYVADRPDRREMLDHFSIEYRQGTMDEIEIKPFIEQSTTSSTT